MRLSAFSVVLSAQHKQKQIASCRGINSLYGAPRGIYKKMYQIVFVYSHVNIVLGRNDYCATVLKENRSVFC